MTAGSGGAAIDLAAMPNLDDLNRARAIIDGVYDAKLTLSNAKSLFNARQFVATRGSWLVGKSDNSRDDALTIFLSSEGFDFLSSGGLDENLICGHVA